MYRDFQWFPTSPPAHWLHLRLALNRICHSAQLVHLFTLFGVKSIASIQMQISYFSVTTNIDQFRTLISNSSKKNINCRL